MLKQSVYTIEQFLHTQMHLRACINTRESNSKSVTRTCGPLLCRDAPLLFTAIHQRVSKGKLKHTYRKEFNLPYDGLTLSTSNFITTGMTPGVYALVAFIIITTSQLY